LLLSLQAIRMTFVAGSAQDAAFRQSASRLAQCARDGRRIFVTGMGKSGIVARRLASSLASVSIASQVCTAPDVGLSVVVAKLQRLNHRSDTNACVPSQWVHGGEWVHGELGGLQAGDVVRGIA
jgi:D-arabinose 5-phosphate isomerase GutQ